MDTGTPPRSSRSSQDPISPATSESALIAAAEAAHTVKTLQYEFTGSREFDGLWVEVLGEKLLLDTVLFCADLAQTFLGRRDFFRHYLVAFDQRNLRFFLERLLDRDEDDDPDAVLVAN